MVHWYWLIVALLGGGVLSWFFAKKVYDKGKEYAAAGEAAVVNTAKNIASKL